MNIDQIELRFTSGNDVPVERAYITATEWAEIKKMKKDADSYQAIQREKAAEADELRKDAERYRWLRDSPDSPIINIGYATDKMVDAAIAQGQTK